MATAWRFRCLKGHTQLVKRTRLGGHYCATCKSSYLEIVDAMSQSQANILNKIGGVNYQEVTYERLSALPDKQVLGMQGLQTAL